MSGPQTVTSDDWSRLNTVRDFDVGLDLNDRNIVRTADLTRPSANSVFIESLIDQLCKLLEQDPKQQRKAYNILCSKLCEMEIIDNTYQIEELASLRSHYQQALVSLMATTNKRVYKIPFPLNNLEMSRYRTDYEEICYVAHGGFGQVFKAKHRLDEVVYAVKKIPLKCQDASTFLTKLGEVKTLAKLNHHNIVQYKAAWLEPLFGRQPSLPSSDKTNTSSTSSDGIVFKDDSTGSSGQSCAQKNGEANNVLCQYGANKSIHKKPKSQLGAVLYVSMQLCDETLKDWLSRRNARQNFSQTVNIPVAIDIMKQAACGIQYIHSCSIVHHDIKPNNIFLGNDLKSVQVGDFGLSCCLQGHNNHSDCPLEGGQFGTTLYAAPEQLRGRGRCNPKSDMFSLGLVLVELLVPFTTDMEKVAVLSKIRSGYLPPSIPFSLLPIVKDLTSISPDDRPTASQLIARLERLSSAKQYDLKSTLTVTKTRLVSLSEESDDGVILHSHLETDFSLLEKKEKLIRDQSEEILRLKRMLAQRDNEIAQLKQVIEQDST